MSDWWDDFFNNLAADLAPLISLFGEQPTKQFISESTSSLDCFILAMAPLGLITIIISAIRVGGNSSLRAFFGRAQEGSGNIEAELCSSTSRDVCELYNNGGIARVFGRPSILEIVQDLQAPDDDFATIRHPPSDRESTEPHESNQMNSSRLTGGIYPFWDYVKRFESYKDRPREWEEPSYTRKVAANPDICQRLCRAFRQSKSVHAERQQPHIVDYENDQLAPHPNLSFNVGIKKRSPVWFILAVTTGLLLQSGVLIFAGLTVSILRETFDKDGKPVDSYAFPFTCVGTILVCVGVGLCAHVVERSTTERVFRRIPSTSQDNAPRGNTTQENSSPERIFPSSRIFWIQPGNQVIGDQFFDSFAFGEPSGSFLSEYISSRKVTQDPKMRRTSMILVCVSAPIAVFGFILQFVGLRALHSTVSIAQLGAMVLMSIIRASLRAQRFRAEENLLGHNPDLYQGHELDWLSIEIFKDQPTEKVRKESEDCPDPSEKLATKTALVWQLRTYPSSQYSNETWDPPLLSTKIFRSRARLARLTGAQSGQPSSQTSSIQWDEDLVAGRNIAAKLTKALEDTITTLLGKSNWSDLGERTLSENDHISVPISCSAMEMSTNKSGTEWILHNIPNKDDVPKKESVCISLSRDKAGQEKWRVEMSEIEALLGLWLWSFRTKADFQRCEEDENEIWKPRDNGRFGENLPCTRLLSVGDTDEDPTRISISPWMEGMGGREMHVQMHFPIKAEFDPACIWIKDRTQTSQPTFYPSHPREPEQGPDMARREWFFGWHLLPPVKPTDSQAAPADSATPQTSSKLMVSAVPSDQNLAMTCAQEIFIMIFKNLLDLVEDIGAETEREYTWHGAVPANSRITEIIKAFTNSGLGSENDALSCIIPTLHAEKKLPIALSFLEDRDRQLKDAFQVKHCIWKMSLFRLCEPSSGLEAESKRLRELRLATEALCKLYKASISVLQPASIRGFGIESLLSLIKQIDEMSYLWDVLSDVLLGYVEMAISEPIGAAESDYEQAMNEIVTRIY